jgi:tetratricopeptide (TPR) repeat protein
MVRRAPGPLVAPAKPMTDAHSTPETLETELNRLVLLLEAVESAWVYAVYDDVPTRDQLIATMRERLAPIAVLERSLAGSGETSPLEFAQQTPVLSNQSAPVICFTGLGNAIMQGHLPNLLDMHREALASTRHRLVFWVRENEWVALLETARNFSSRIAGSFDFRKDTELSLGSELRTKRQLLTAKKRLNDSPLQEYKIESIRNQILNLDENDDNNARKLAHLYSDLGEVYGNPKSPRFFDAESAHLTASRLFKMLNNDPACARELFKAGESAAKSGVIGVSVQHYQQALKFYIKTGDRSGQADSLKALGSIIRTQGRPNEAIEIYQQAFKIYSEIGDLKGEAGTLERIGITKQFQAYFSDSFIFYKRAIIIYTKINDQDGQASALERIGDIKIAQGESTKALVCYDLALKIYTKIDNHLGISSTLERIGDIKVAQGEQNQALENYSQALNHYIETGRLIGKANTLMRIGSVKQYQGELNQAIENYNQALGIYIELGLPLGQSSTKSYLAQVALLLGNESESGIWFREALEILQSLGYRHDYAEAIGDYGLTLQKVGKPLEARPYLEQAIELFEALEVPKIAQRYRDALK